MLCNAKSRCDKLFRVHASLRKRDAGHNADLLGGDKLKGQKDTQIRKASRLYFVQLRNKCDAGK